MQPKRIADSQVSLTQMMGPQDANILGNVHGGVIMKLVDEAGALAAMRHAQNVVVTVAVDSMTFKKPIRIGDVVRIDARLTYVGRSAIEVRVDVIAEHPFQPTAEHTNSAYIVYVALDPEGRPALSPACCWNRARKARWREAESRQERRKALRAQEKEHPQ
ncbi:MAG: acyl-CoA thioesterase [Anaerolineae bacterium]|nr:acyl-CoA thioesterase [Anaerolineae bacterium]